MPISNQLPGRTVRINGKEYLHFAGTSYLGMATHPAFRELLKGALARYGLNFGGSRRGNVRLEVYEAAEAHLAEFTGAPAALTVSSGSLAGQLLLRYLETQGRRLFCSPDLHPALRPAGSRAFEGAYADWTVWVREQLQEDPAPAYLLLNAIDPIYVRTYDFSWLRDLPHAQRHTLVVDDSHALGVRGERGEGSYSRLRELFGGALIVMSSLGKAFAIPGGCILGAGHLIQDLWASPYFGGASPTPPAYLAAFLEGWDLYGAQLEVLRKRLRQLQAGLADRPDFRMIADYPVVFAGDEGLADFLWERGVLVSCFRYPGAEDARITRVVVNGGHEGEDIRLLVGLCWGRK